MRILTPFFVATTAETIATISFTNAALNADSLRESDDVGKTTLKDTTSKEALQSYVIAALTAGVTQYGAAKLNVAVPSSATTTERVTTNTLNAITRASIQTSTQIVATSIVKGQSINETIEEQGGLDQVIKNTVAMAIGEAGSKEIGYQYHNYNISQPIQLTLHGIVGATTSTLMGGDALSGAAAAIAGEYTADSLYQSGLGANFSIALGQTAGSGAALLTSLLQGRSDEQTATNIQTGSFVASNAAVYNATRFRGTKIFPYPEKDYDLNIGIEYTTGPVSVTHGTDGNGVTVNTIPGLGMAGYFNIIPSGESSVLSASYGIRDIVTFDAISTNKGNAGFGMKYGINVLPVPIPFNSGMSVDFNK